MKVQTECFLNWEVFLIKIRKTIYNENWEDKLEKIVILVNNYLNGHDILFTKVSEKIIIVTAEL